MSAAAAAPAGRDRLARVVLTGESLTRLSPLLEADRAQAVADLERDNTFALTAEAVPAAAQQSHPGARPAGPYVLHLAIVEGRLLFDIHTEDGAQAAVIGLALGPFRGIIKDYQLLVDSHMMAAEEGRAERMEAIDMGRRGLHNEGASLLQGRLERKVGIDHETARRLFTLVCVLHQRI